MDINGIYVEWYWFALIIGCIGLLIGSAIGYYTGARDADNEIKYAYNRGYRNAINDHNLTPNQLPNQMRALQEENSREIKRAKGMAAYAYFMGK